MFVVCCSRKNDIHYFYTDDLKKQNKKTESPHSQFSLFFKHTNTWWSLYYIPTSIRTANAVLRGPSGGQYSSMTHQLWASAVMISKRCDWNWGEDTTLATEMPSWSDNERRGEAERGFSFRTIGHNFVDPSPERLRHLTLRYKLFCSIYKTNKWPLSIMSY